MLCLLPRSSLFTTPLNVVMPPRLCHWFSLLTLSVQENLYTFMAPNPMPTVTSTHIPTPNFMLKFPTKTLIPTKMSSSYFTSDMP